MIGIAVVFLALFLLMPLLAVFAEALRRGAEAYFSAFADPDTQSAIQLTLLVAVIAVPVLVQQWRRTRREGTEYPSTFVKVFGPLYLVVFAVLHRLSLAYAGGVGQSLAP